MDWKLAIKRNREGLVAVIAGLAAMAETAQELPHPRPLHRFIARILRPAEAALRRLIVVVAAALLQKAKAVAKSGEAQTAKPLPDFSAFARGQNYPVFPLIDPRKRFGEAGRFAGFDRVLPRISVPGVSGPFQPVKQDETVDTAALLRRIARLEAALKTLPKQARRLNRLMARRAKAKPGPGRVGPIRPGSPPGYKQRSPHEVHAILGECHALAQTSGLKPP